MGTGETPLTREEFLAHIGYVRADLNDVKTHLGALNGRTRANETAIAVLADRHDDTRRRNRRAGAAWGGSVSAIVVAIIEGVRMYLASGK